MKRKALFLVIFTTFISAQPYWSMEDFQSFEESYQSYRQSPLRRELYESDYNFSYPFKYLQSADFVASWQVTDSSSEDFGGIIEAEEGELHDVIQTDNTQESVIIWSFAKTFYSTDVYDPYTLRSWYYCNAYPAWEEEISDYSEYYPYWNSGLGLLATIYHVEHTGDSTYLEYGDSCAAHLMENRLPFIHDVDYYARLHPLVTSFAAGCLYQYATFRDNPEYRERALWKAGVVLDHIEENPDSFLAIEQWAMSSGTLVWGLMKSHFAEHPEELETWLDTNFRYIREMAPPAEEYDPYLWDNSWNIWYANGYRAIYEATADTIAYNRYRHILDYILAQDYDDDGGLMSSFGHPATEDMSWVTTYILFMGIEGVLHELPDIDLGATDIEIMTDLPIYIVGDSVEVKVKSANCGLVETTGSNQFIWGDETESTSLYLELGQRISHIKNVVPEEAGILELISISKAEGDMDASNDTITTSLTIRGITEYFGDVISDDEEPISAILRFTLVLPETTIVFAETETDPDGRFNVELPEGEYLIDVFPAFPYPDVYDIEVAIYPPIEPLAITIPNAHVLLVDDDGGSSWEQFIASSLDSLGISYHLFERDIDGEITADMALDLEFRTVLWLCGTDSTETLTENDMMAIENLLDAGNYAIITGQYISDELEGTGFLEETVGAVFAGNLTRNFMRGILDDPITGDFDHITTTGLGSAGNSRDHDRLRPIDSEAIVVSNEGDTLANAVRREFPSGGKLVYFGFGLESIGKLAGMEGAATRTELLRRVFAWFSPEWNIPEYIPVENAFISAYPNPFNSTLHIQTPAGSTIEIFDARGRKVFGSACSTEGTATSWTPSEELSSGIYNIRLTGSNTNGTNVLYIK